MTGRSGPAARQDCDGTHPTTLGRSSSYIRPAAPVPGRSRQQRADKSAHDTTGSVIPRVTPAATGRGPDHHRTEGSLTVIPPGTTRKTGSDQTDETTDLACKDGTAQYIVDSWSPTHNRSVAGSRPASPTQTPRSTAWADCFACSVVIPSSFPRHSSGAGRHDEVGRRGRDPQARHRPPGPGLRRP